MQPVRDAVSYRGLFTAGWFGVREKHYSRLEIYDRLRASEQAAYCYDTGTRILLFVTLIFSSGLDPMNTMLEPNLSNVQTKNKVKVCCCLPNENIKTHMPACWINTLNTS